MLTPPKQRAHWLGTTVGAGEAAVAFRAPVLQLRAPQSLWAPFTLTSAGAVAKGRVSQEVSQDQGTGQRGLVECRNRSVKWFQLCALGWVLWWLGGARPGR